MRSEDKLRAEVTNEIARAAPVAAPGRASPPAPEAVAAKPAKESGSISSGLGQTLQGVAVIFSMLVCVAAFGVLGALIAAPVAAIVDILQDVLHRKRYLPSVTDGDLARLAGKALEKRYLKRTDATPSEPRFKNGTQEESSRKWRVSPHIRSACTRIGCHRRTTRTRTTADHEQQTLPTQCARD